MKSFIVLIYADQSVDANANTNTIQPARCINDDTTSNITTTSLSIV